MYKHAIQNSANLILTSIVRHCLKVFTNASFFIKQNRKPIFIYSVRGFIWNRTLKFFLFFHFVGLYKKQLRYKDKCFVIGSLRTNKNHFVYTTAPIHITLYYSLWEIQVSHVIYCYIAFNPIICRWLPHELYSDVSIGRAVKIFG
jgi:hypothetical protein